VGITTNQKEKTVMNNNSSHPGDGCRGDHRSLATEKVRLRGPQDVLTAIPYLLGFVPDRSLVVLALADGQVQLTARLDLPTPEKAPTAAVTLARALAKTATSDVMLVGYGEAVEVVSALTTFAAVVPWPVREILRVEADRWWSLTCYDPQCCPPGARLTVNAAVAAPLIAASGSPAASRADRAAALGPGPTSLLDQVGALLDTTLPDLDADQQYAAVCDIRATRHDGRAPMTPEHAAFLHQALRDVRVRDACTIWVDEAALNLWLDLLPTAPPGWVAPAATLLALTAYQRGDGALSVLALDRALDDNPGYHLAALVDQFTTRGISPATVSAVLSQALMDRPPLGASPPRTP
jgi:hypothetical protein